MITFGWILMAIGLICLIIGIVVAVSVALQRLAHKNHKQFLQAADEGTFSFWKVVVEFLRELLKQPGGVFLSIGLILFGAGFYIVFLR